MNIPFLRVIQISPDDNVLKSWLELLFLKDTDVLRRSDLHNSVFVFLPGYLGIRPCCGLYHATTRLSYAPKLRDLSLPTLHLLLILATEVIHQAPSLLTSSARHRLAYSVDESNICLFFDCLFRFFGHLHSLYIHTQHSAKVMKKINMSMWKAFVSSLMMPWISR